MPPSARRRLSMNQRGRRFEELAANGFGKRTGNSNNANSASADGVEIATIVSSAETILCRPSRTASRRVAGAVSDHLSSTSE